MINQGTVNHSGTFLYNHCVKVFCLIGMLLNLILQRKWAMGDFISSISQCP